MIAVTTEDLEGRMRKSLRFALILTCCAALWCACAAGVAVRDEWDASGKIVLEGPGWSARFDKEAAALVVSSNGQAVLVKPFAHNGAEADRLVSCEVSGKGRDVRATFMAGGETMTAQFHFSSHGVLRTAPGDGMQGARIRAPIAVGVLPGLRLEDVLYRAEEYPDTREVHVPVENWFAGLLSGNDGIVACAWPEGEHTLNLLLEGEGSGIAGLDTALNGKEMYLELLTAPGIWHEEEAQLDQLERDAALDWQRPFPAAYKTQLLLKAETSTVRTFRFRPRRDRELRPEVGTYTCPVWFQGDAAHMHLCKRIPPKGHAVFYPIDEGEYTLMGFMRRTPLGGLIEARNKRAPLPHGPRDSANVGCVACGGTSIIRYGVYERGPQPREKAFLKEHADFLADYVAIIQQKNASYFVLVDNVRAKLAEWADDAEALAFLDSMRAHADRTEAGLREKMELLGGNTPEAHSAHASRMAERLKLLVETGDPEVSPECGELVSRLNRLSWGHDEWMGMRFSMLSRAWAQEAAHGCADNPATVACAREIRATIREALNGTPPW